MDANIENELDSQSFAVLERSNSHLTKVFVHDQINMTAKDVRKQIFWASGGQKGANVIIPTIKELLPGCTRIGKNPSSAFTFFSFIDENSKNEAIARLTKISFRGTQWKVLEPTEEDLDNLHRGHTATKRQRSGQTPEGEETQTNSIAPWKDIPYVDQLKRKQTHCEAILRQICANIKKWAYRDQQKLPQWLEVKLSQDSKCMCVPFSAVLPSPQTIGYRNQNRFTVGWDNENKPVIGFNTGAARDLHFTVFPVMGVPMVSEISQTLITTVSNWITHFVPHLQPYHKSLKTGFWRSVCIRETTSGEVMLTFQTTSNYTPEFTREKIRSLATDQLAPHVTSLQWQEWDGSCNAASPDLHFAVLSGPAVIHERVTKEQRPFCLSPTSFFQVNTRAAELLLQTIKEEANVSKSKILLDLCCGTGFFGLCFSSDAHWVIGVEMLSSAVEDANRNAVMQGVTNVSFICSKLEHATSEIEKLVEEKKKQYTGAYGDIEIIAIVDPPRSGLHGKVAKWLRSHRSINHLIYISCCQDSLVKDTLSLCKAPTKEFINEPFEPIKSFGVDLFPHTPHVEQVLILRRNSKEA